MRSVRFVSRPLPDGLDAVVRERLAAAHGKAPFTPLDTRDAARRAAAVIAGTGLSPTVYRGGVDLRGVEVDHVWLAVVASDPDDDGSPPFVVDAAFPLFAPRFVAALRRYVTGDLSREELAVAAEGSALDERVVGLIPPPIRYLGAPVWSAR